MTPQMFSGRFPQLSSSLGAGGIDALLAVCEQREADAGEALVAEGTTSADLFLVLDGTLDITMGGPQGVRELAKVEPGSLFGEVSLLDPGPADANVVSQQGCALLVLTRQRFDELSSSHPAAAVALLQEVVQSLAARLRRASAQVGQPVEIDDEGIAAIGGEDSEALAGALEIGTTLARRFREVTRAVRTRVVEVRRESVVKEYDVVVIGAGPHALAYATWIKQDRPETRIALVDKRTAPGFKIGESTLGPVVRAAMSLGVPLPVLRRLFNNKIGLHFWWMGENSDELHGHVDHVLEETYQLERRVFELLMLNVARRAGVDVYQGTKALIDDSRIHGQPKELVCETASGDVLRLRSSILCDASGPAAVIGRHLGIRRKMADFNTSAYWGYFMKRSDVNLPGWEVPATRHLCFPQGWVWFIELASWERAADANLNAMIDHLLDKGSPDESAYPTRRELAEQFDCPLDQWPISIGVVPRTDIDSAADLPLEERFRHYVDRYPVFKRIMDTYDLIEDPYEGHPSYISYTEITQHSDRYAGDGWLLIGDAAYFVNPLYSPGLTYGHSLASFAAAETVSALERADFSEEAFKGHDAAARQLYSSLVAECESWYRAFRHVDAYERIQLFRVAFFISLGYQRILQFGGPGAMRIMRPVRPHGPKAEPITNPGYNEILHRLIDRMRALEEKGADPAETGRAVKEIVDPIIEEICAIEGVAALHLGQAFERYDDRLQLVGEKENWESLVPVWHCPRCDNNPPVEFETCYVCGQPAPEGVFRPRPAAAMPVPVGHAPPR
jgi:flavin-dependent dehydrogenase/CRP-like cAMP-binding protein